jgi:anti-sigma factor RsiW
MSEEALATRDEAEWLAAALTATLHAMGEALTARLDRGVRHQVLALSVLMMATAAAAVLVAWSASRTWYQILIGTASSPV